MRYYFKYRIKDYKQFSPVFFKFGVDLWKEKKYLFSLFFLLNSPIWAVVSIFICFMEPNKNIISKLDNQIEQLEKELAEDTWENFKNKDNG